MIKKIDQKFIGDFQLVDFHTTHGQLLLRFSSGVGGSNVNLDITFYMTRYIEMPTILNDIHITNGTEEDWLYVESRFNDEVFRTPPANYEQLFKILSEDKVYFIMASHCSIVTNSLLPGQTSIPVIDKYL